MKLRASGKSEGGYILYAGHLSHLQYRLHRAPSTKLVMDLIACQEELNVVIQITQQQIDMLVGLQSVLEAKDGPQPTSQQASPVAQRPTSAGYRGYAEMDAWTGPRHRATYRQISASHLSDPMAQVLDNLQRELVDLHELRDNTDRLVTRTIQLVNIRLEDHGKAILVFTVVTIVFLPLNFVSSFFGMNFVDIRNMDRTQGLFWLVAVCVTFGVVAASLFLAFSGGDILEKLIMWRDARRERQRRQVCVTSTDLHRLQNSPRTQLMQHSKKGNAPCEPKPIDPARTTTLNRFLPSTTSASQPRTLPPPFRLASLTKPSQDSAEIPDGHSAADASEYKDFTGCSMPLALAGSGLSVRQAIDQHFEHGEQDDYTGTLGFETDQTELAVHDQEAMYEYTVPQKRKADPESDEDSFPMQPELSRRRRKYSVDDEDSDEDEEMNTPTTHRGSLLWDGAVGEAGGDDAATNAATQQEEDDVWHDQIEGVMDSAILEGEDEETLRLSQNSDSEAAPFSLSSSSKSAPLEMPPTSYAGCTPQCEAKGLNFKSTQEGLAHAQPELNAKEMVHTRGSSEHTRIIAMVHYLTYTTNGSLINQSIADPQTSCVKWLFHFLGGLRETVLYDFCPIRLRRLDGSDHVVERVLNAVSLASLEKDWLTEWKKPGAKIDIVKALGLIGTKIYGEETHTYLEYDSTGKPIRLTFLIYHPESHLLYKVPKPVKELRRPIRRSAKVWLRAIKAVEKRKIRVPATLPLRIAQLMHTESRLDVTLCEEDVPEDIKQHLGYNLPLPIREMLSKDKTATATLPFGPCTLVANLIGQFDRDGIELPRHLDAIEPKYLAILRGPIFRAARSFLLPPLLYALDKLEQDEGLVRRNNANESIWIRWKASLWREYLAFSYATPEAFQESGCSTVSRLATSTKTLMSDIRLRVIIRR
ncbi:hypothetical protein LTR15_003396 [Elasticomyces elasticus]|nr:hypothetical protein LTR15_003396 [Elasticomyces elasticus]